MAKAKLNKKFLEYLSKYITQEITYNHQAGSTVEHTEVLAWLQEGEEAFESINRTDDEPQPTPAPGQEPLTEYTEDLDCEKCGESLVLDEASISDADKYRCNGCGALHEVYTYYQISCLETD